jgi:hypothetical protein
MTFCLSRTLGCRRSGADTQLRRRGPPGIWNQVNTEQLLNRNDLQRKEARVAFLTMRAAPFISDVGRET